MRYYPIYLDTYEKKIIVSGAGNCSIAKLRLLLKTNAQIVVCDENPEPMVVQWASEGRLILHNRFLQSSDLDGALLLYAANDDAALDSTARQLGRQAGVKTLIVDNLEDSDFITPAIVDRTPVTVAIGTEGAAPVLARKIKADIEQLLPPSLGILARIGKNFRPLVTRLPFGWARREFWARYYFDQGPKALAEGEWAVKHILHSLLNDMEREPSKAGHVDFVGAGPGDPELLTLKARKLIHEAEVVIYDRLVSDEVLELARREAHLIEVGKTPYGPSWRQDDINALLTEHGKSSRVVRLKSGDGGIFGRLDEEVNAMLLAGISHAVTPGITSAAAAASELKVGLTRRGSNSELRIITGHNESGFAEQDWENLAKPGAVAAIYMGKTASAFIQGRLLMHGANAATAVTIVENVSRTDQTITPATIATFPTAIKHIKGPAVLMLGLAPSEHQLSQEVRAQNG